MTEVPARFRKVRLNPPEAADYCAAIHGVTVAPTTLAKLRSVGGGPKFEKFGARAVFYRVADLDAWVAEKLGRPRASTATN